MDVAPLIAIAAGLLIVGLWAILSRYTSNREDDDGGSVSVDIDA